LTERPNPTTYPVPMMDFIRSLRIARVLALLAVLLTAGFGQHVHAAKADLTLAIVGDCVTSEKVPSEQEAPGAVHCAFCHAVRAMLPAPESLRAPMLLANRQIPVESTRQLDSLAPVVPSPPPRRSAAG
jgi:hypothetical protein